MSERTGALLWRDVLPEQVFPYSMIVSAGVIYLADSGEGSTVYAITESGGARRWTTSIYDADPITLAGGTLMLTGSNADSCALSAQTGTLQWTRSQYCSGGGTGLASFDGTHVWGEDPAGGGEGSVYNPKTGAVVKQFPGYAPAFGYHEAVQAIVNSAGSLAIQGFNPATLGGLWTFDEPNGASNPVGSTPLLADGFAFAEGSHGQVWVLEPCTGTIVWTATAGGPAPYFGFDPLPGLSAGGGYLIAPTETGFTAFRGSGAPTSPPPACEH